MSDQVRKCCRGGWFMALLLAGGIAAAGFLVKTPCVSCTKQAACKREACEQGKTPLWRTAYESVAK